MDLTFLTNFNNVLKSADFELFKHVKVLLFIRKYGIRFLKMFSFFMEYGYVIFECVGQNFKNIKP